MSNLFTNVTDKEAAVIELLSEVDEKEFNWDIILQFIPSEPLINTLTHRECLNQAVPQDMKSLAYDLVFDNSTADSDELLYWLNFYSKE